jgi:hypothetical protein
MEPIRLSEDLLLPTLVNSLELLILDHNSMRIGSHALVSEVETVRSYAEDTARLNMSLTHLHTLLIYLHLFVSSSLGQIHGETLLYELASDLLSLGLAVRMNLHHSAKQFTSLLNSLAHVLVSLIEPLNDALVKLLLLDNTSEPALANLGIKLALLQFHQFSCPLAKVLSIGLQETLKLTKGLA